MLAALTASSRVCISTPLVHMPATFGPYSLLLLPLSSLYLLSAFPPFLLCLCLTRGQSRILSSFVFEALVILPLGISFVFLSFLASTPFSFGLVAPPPKHLDGTFDFYILETRSLVTSRNLDLALQPRSLTGLRRSRF